MAITRDSRRLPASSAERWLGGVLLAVLLLLSHTIAAADLSQGGVEGEEGRAPFPAGGRHYQTGESTYDNRPREARPGPAIAARNETPFLRILADCDPAVRWPATLEDFLALGLKISVVDEDEYVVDTPVEVPGEPGTFWLRPGRRSAVVWRFEAGGEIDEPLAEAMQFQTNLDLAKPGVYPVRCTIHDVPRPDSPTPAAFDPPKVIIFYVEVMGQASFTPADGLTPRSVHYPMDQGRRVSAAEVSRLSEAFPEWRDYMTRSENLLGAAPEYWLFTETTTHDRILPISTLKGDCNDAAVFRSGLGSFTARLMSPGLLGNGLGMYIGTSSESSFSSGCSGVEWGHVTATLYQRFVITDGEVWLQARREEIRLPVCEPIPVERLLEMDVVVDLPDSSREVISRSSIEPGFVFPTNFTTLSCEIHFP
jgi:hypothetical protein